MCRHLAYLGPPIPLGAVLTGPPHSLLHQSYAPTDMRRGGRINADGFGFGWYPQPGGEAARYRRDCPMWSDGNLATLAGTISSGAILAAVRNATVGMPVMETAAAPFAEGPWLFSHNGAVTDWPHAMTKLAGQLPGHEPLTLDAPTDAALLWALVRARLRAGATPVEAVVATVRETVAAAPGSRLNFLLTDGARIVATTAGHALSVHRCADRVLVASEPLDDDPDWQPVPEGKLVVATPSDVDIADWGSV